VIISRVDPKSSHRKKGSGRDGGPVWSQGWARGFFCSQRKGRLWENSELPERGKWAKKHKG
jgi:hypothetical protein